MKTLLVLSLITLGFTANAQPIANAGPDQTIYLTQTNSVTLNGSASSGDSYQWTDISANIGYPMLMNLGVEGHPTNTGSITSPTSATTTVTGLSQGVWYYQIAVTTSGSTKYDTMMVNVDYAPPPGTFINGLEFTNPIIYNYINSRTDTTQLTGGPDGVNVNGLYYFFDRARSNSMYVDAMKGKFYSVLEDGYGWQSTPTSYARVEGSYGTGYSLDTNKTYCFEWKGYFPQAFDFIQDNQDLVGFMQVHANDGSTGTFGLSLLNGYVGGDHSRGAAGVQGFYATIGGSYTFLANLSSFVNTTHTIRWTFREGAAYPGQDAFLKIEIDGVQKYFINNRKIGGTLGEDYPKWATLYDYGNALVDPNNHTRNKKFAMVTERFSIYDVSGGSNQSPTANAGSNQTITLPTNSVSLSGSGSDADGTISSYLWSKISGPSQGTISNPNSSSTNVSGLVQGVYQFQLTVTDNKGATGKSTMQVTVNSSSNQPPTANAGANQNITLPVNNVSLSGSGNDPDGTISSYLWTKISGPSTYTIVNPSSATTNVSGLVQGNYTFQLKVTDNNGATGTDTVQVKVTSSSNQPPSANAGANQSITLPTNSISLSGSGNDPDGTISSYLWTKISGPSSYTIANPSSATTNVSDLVKGSYTFQLKVTDNNGATGTDTVLVTVNSANQPPSANAGANQSITLPTNSISLSGSGNDPDGTISSYLWTKISGPSSYTIANPSSATTNVSDLVKGSYTFQLKVTDNNGATGTDTVLVTVNSSNQPPSANAGANQSITLPTNTVNLSGSGSDADGTIASYLWTKISGPSTFNIVSPNSAATNISGLVQGVYYFQLTVTDNRGDIGTASVRITVNAAANQPPIANAGSNQTITLPTNSINLTGSGSDTDGTIASYQWTKISGPSTYTIGSPNSATTNVSGLVQGVYQFQLTVTDNNGDIGSDNVQIIVNAAANIPPTANAGSNKSITLPTNSVSLAGSGSDVDGTIASYQWTKISGPSAYTIATPNSATTNVSGLAQGVYQFQLTVTDNNGDIGSDNVQVTVNAETNMPPTANAGSNQSISLPTNSVSLSGSGSDADGTIASYQWTKISGPSAYTIATPNSATTNVSELAQGVYQFQLTVTDNKGAKGTANVQVAVNATPSIPPTADAGSNSSITLPTNIITLTGSGSDADGTIASYKWSKISGPSAFNIVNPASPVTDVSGLVEGVYQFQLTVTDNDGNIGTALVRITVNAAPNIPPTANAGSNKSITLPTNSVSLSGSGSDSDGTIASYLWTKISGPSSFNISSPNSATTNVSGLVQGTYQFRLAVTDNDGAVGIATIRVTVYAAANIPPTANAGSNKNITLPTNSVNLSGSGSDADGTIASYQWTKISGPSAFNIVNPTTPVTDILGLVQGVYYFQLSVTDNNGGKGTSIVQVKVNAAANIPPIANAGSNKSITLPANTVSLTGSGSDADGTISTYKWIKISGPSSYNIVNASSPVTDVSGLVQGVYKFQLTVTDNKGDIGTATVQITVNAAANKPPKAVAGSNKSITLPLNSVSLTGSGSDADGTIASYKWTKISGPSSFNITSPNSAATTISGLVQGVYQFQLAVTDNKGDIGTATVQITVNAAANKPPTANAGSNKSITLPVNSVSLSGSGSDADGTIASYQWTKISGPSSFNIASPNSNATNVTGLVQGLYQFQLTVKDNNGATGTATVQVTVNNGITTNVVAPNTAPVANAGNDTTIVSPASSVTLNGKGTDADGNVTGYLWNQISGPSGSTISSNNTAVTNVSNLVEGTYEFELTVTDNKGSVGKDTVNVTVALGRFARQDNSLKVYPNPVHDIATLEINTGKNNTNLMIVITDMNGKTVYRQESVSSLSDTKLQINMSNLIKGTYVIAVFFDGIDKKSIKVLRM